MKKRFNLFYIFAEDEAQNKVSREKSAQIQKIIDAFFYALKHDPPALPEEKEEKKESKNG